VQFNEAALLKAVELAKTDLTAELVKEFTELQGIIGGLYARAQHLGERVALAIYEQYTPAGIEDPIPVSVEGQLLGIADRIQTITAMFGIGQIPSGSKDPFALRRAANAIVKILAESELPLTIFDVITAAAPEPANREAVTGFFRERLHFYLKDVRNFAYDVVNAVVSAKTDVGAAEFTVGAENVRDTIARAEALTTVRGSEDFAAVSAAFKRIKNILRQAEEKKFEIAASHTASLADEALRLRAAAAGLVEDVTKLRQQRDYADALALIATLRPVVDTFFDKVMVLDPDPAIRSANLAIIEEVLRNFSTIADFSEIVTS
jgi:glycyl-tRNA synthetase beta chain